jgi:hypothetical protein
MRVAIVPFDNIVTVDGQSLRIDCSSFASLSGVHAVHWDSEKNRGHIQYDNSDLDEPDDYRANENITSIAAYQDVIVAFNAAKTVEDAKPTLQVVNPLSIRQFYQVLAVRGLIAKAEALSALKNGILPQLLQTFVDGISDADKNWTTAMFLIGSNSFSKDHPVVVELIASKGWSKTQVDDLWQFGATL